MMYASHYSRMINLQAFGPERIETEENRNNEEIKRNKLRKRSETEQNPKTKISSDCSFLIKKTVLAT